LDCTSLSSTYPGENGRRRREGRGPFPLCISVEEIELECN